MKKYFVNVEITMNNEVYVDANSVEEAREIAKREISKSYEYVDFSSDNMDYIGGYGTEKVISCEEVKVCCICGKEEANNNAEPYTSGECCNECNMKYVIPARIKNRK